MMDQPVDKPASPVDEVVWQARPDLLVAVQPEHAPALYTVSVRETGRAYRLTSAQLAALQRLDEQPEFSGAGAGTPAAFVQQLAAHGIIASQEGSRATWAAERDRRAAGAGLGPQPRPTDGGDPVALARWALERAVRYGRWPLVRWPLPETFTRPGAAFVCLKRDGLLRGCFGSIRPRRERLADDLAQAAMGAAYWDDRFTLVRPDELDDLEITVDLIGEPVVAALPPSWDPATTGVQLQRGDHVLATLLPGLEHVATAEQQLRLAHRKAGTAATHGGSGDAGGGPDLEELSIECFTTCRWPSPTPIPLRPDPRAITVATWDLAEEDPK